MNSLAMPILVFTRPRRSVAVVEHESRITHSNQTKPQNLNIGRLNMKEKRRRRKKHNSFVMLDRWLLFQCKEWQDLSNSARVLYVLLKGKYNGSNNGEIRLYYSELLKYKGFSSSSTIRKAIKELEEKGWIGRTRIGGLIRYSNKFKLTGRYDRIYPQSS